MTTAKERRIEKMLFDPAEIRVWHLEVSLIVVVEACQISNMLHRLDGNSEDDHTDNDCSKSNEDVI